MKKLLFIAFVVATLASCSKNQKAVKTLDGKWKATSFIVTDGSDSFDFLLLGVSFEMQFENCKLKKEETCDITLTTSDGDDTEVENGQYKVIDDGSKMEFIGDNNQSEIYTIKELTKTKLVLVLTDDDLTGTITLSKQ